MRLRGYVYFARAQDGTLKIGFTGSTRSRAYSLKADRRQPVDILTYRVGTLATERLFIAMLGERPVVGKEWFAPTPRAIAMFRAVLAPTDTNISAFSSAAHTQAAFRDAVVGHRWFGGVPAALAIVAPFSLTLARTGS